MRVIRLTVHEFGSHDIEARDGWMFGHDQIADMSEEEIFFAALVAVKRLNLRRSDRVVLFDNSLMGSPSLLVTAINAFRGSPGQLWIAHKNDSAKTGWDYQGVH